MKSQDFQKSGFSKSGFWKIGVSKNKDFWFFVYSSENLRSPFLKNWDFESQDFEKSGFSKVRILKNRVFIFFFFLIFQVEIEKWVFFKNLDFQKSGFWKIGIFKIWIFKNLNFQKSDFFLSVSYKQYRSIEVFFWKVPISPLGGRAEVTPLRGITFSIFHVL